MNLLYIEVDPAIHKVLNLKTRSCYEQNINRRREKVEFDQAEALCCEGLTAESKRQGGCNHQIMGWMDLCGYNFTFCAPLCESCMAG